VGFTGIVYSNVSAGEDDGAPKATEEQTEGKFVLSNARGAARPAGEEGGRDGAAAVTGFDHRSKIRSCETKLAATAAEDDGGTGVMEDESSTEGRGYRRASPRGGEVSLQGSEEVAGDALLEAWLQRWIVEWQWLIELLTIHPTPETLNPKSSWGGDQVSHCHSKVVRVSDAIQFHTVFYCLFE